MAKDKKSNKPKTGVHYEAVQDFHQWNGSEKIDYKEGQDMSDVHPANLERYMQAGLIRLVADKTEESKPE